MADAFSWRIAFLAGGSAACASIFLLPSFATQLEAKNESSLSFKESLSCTIKSKPITNAILGYALHTFALTSVGAFIPTYGVTFGFSLSEISTIFGAILVVAGALGTILGGKIVQKYAASSKSWGQAYFRFTSFTTLIAIPFFATCFWTSDWRLFLVACAIAELFVFAGVASLNSILVNECSPSLVAFTQGATVFTINLLGSLPGPIITGLIADKWGLAFALQVTTIALLSSGIIWLKGSVIITKK